MAKAPGLDSLIESWRPETKEQPTLDSIIEGLRPEQEEPKRERVYELPERFRAKERAKQLAVESDVLRTREKLRKYPEEYGTKRMWAASLDREALEQYAAEVVGKPASPTREAVMDEIRSRRAQARGEFKRPVGWAVGLLTTIMDVDQRAMWRAPGHWLAPRLRDLPPPPPPMGMQPLPEQRPPGPGEPGYQQHKPTWAEAWDMSRYGWPEDMIAGGIPWYIAYPVGILLEAASSPLALTGIGLGGRAVKEIGEETGEAALKALTRPKGLALKVRDPRTLFKPWGQAIRSPKLEIPIPLTGTIQKGLARAGRAFAPAREPTEQLLRGLWAGIAEPKALAAKYEILTAIHPMRQELANMSLSAEAYQRAYAAAEVIQHVRDGKSWAKKMLDEILDSPDELKAADLFRDMFDAGSVKVKELGLPYPAQEAALLTKRAGIETQLGKMEAKAARYVREAQRMGWQADRAERLVSTIERQAAKGRDVLGEWFAERAPGVAKRAERLSDEASFAAMLPIGVKTKAEMANAADDAFALYQRIQNVSKDFDRMTLDEVLVLGREVTGIEQAERRGAAALERAGVQRAAARSKIEKAQVAIRNRLAKRSSYLAEKADTATGIADKLSRQPGITKTARIEAIETAEDAYSSYLGLKGVGAKLTDIPRSELDRALRKWLPKAEYGRVTRSLAQLDDLRRVQGVAEKAIARPLVEGAPASIPRAAARELEDLGEAVGQLTHLYGLRAQAKHTASKLQDAVAGRLIAAEAVAQTKEFQRLIARARHLDDEFLQSAGYVPRPRGQGKVTARAPGGVAQVQPIAKPLTLSSSAKKRVALTESGRSKYIWESEGELRAALLDKDVLDANKWIKDGLSQAYNTTDIGKAVRAAKADVEKGALVMGRLIETRPVAASNAMMHRLVNDVETMSMVESMGKLAVDAKTADFAIPATDFGPLVAKRWKGKYFPAELRQEYAEWSGRMSKAMGDKTLPGKIHDTAMAYWKFSVTGPNPAFQLRNGLDDTWRAFANGPYNPVRQHVDGLKMAWGSPNDIIDLSSGGMGKLTVPEADLLCEAYGIGGGMMKAEIGNVPGAWAMRPFGMLEDVRRKGYFFEMIRQGNSPVESRRLMNRVFFDYERMAQWERTAAKRIIPFWNFRKNNMRFQVETLFNQPWWTASQMRLFRQQAEKEPPTGPIVPDYLRDRTKIMFQEPGVTRILYGAGLSVEELVTITDAVGNPTKLWEKVCDEAKFQVSPLIKGAVKAVAAGMKGTWGLNRIRAPEGASQLPAGVKSWLGIRKEKWYTGEAGRYRDQWTMPSVAKTIMQESRQWNEAMRYFRADRTRELTGGEWDGVISSLTGLTMVKLSRMDTEIFGLQERVRTGYQEAEKDGILGPRGHVTPEGRRTPGGRQLQRDVNRLRDLRVRQLRHREREMAKYEE